MSPCARTHDAKIVRSRDMQCNTKELPQNHLQVTKCYCSLYDQNLSLKFVMSACGSYMYEGLH